MYSWVPGAQVKLDPEVVGQELERIRERYSLNAELVVHEAKRETAPLHDYFEWDDETAAHNYRLDQARYLIRSIAVEMPGKNQQPIQVRAFVSMKEGYESTVRVMSDAEMRGWLLKKALGELDAFRRKYQHLEELAEVFSAARLVEVAVAIG